jgi:hypothetical protein
MPHKKRRSKAIAHSLVRPGKTIFADIPIRAVLIIQVFALAPFSSGLAGGRFTFENLSDRF